MRVDGGCEILASPEYSGLGLVKRFFFFFFLIFLLIKSFGIMESYFIISREGKG